MNRLKIEKELMDKGWFRTEIDKKCSCGSWPEKHVRVTMWDSKRPTDFSQFNGDAIGFEYAHGDGSTVAEAFAHLKRNIENGYSEYFPGSYNSNVEKDYKEWKRSKSKKTGKSKVLAKK